MTRFSFLFIFVAALAAACHPESNEPDGREVDSSVINFDNAIDVSDDGTVFSGWEQSPDLANPGQPVSVYCYGDKSPGWQGSGCWSGLPVSVGDEFQGFAVKLPPDGVFRMGFGNRPVTDEPDDPNWFKHEVGVDTSAEWDWLLEFEECGIQKVNLCARMVDGFAEPAKADCAALYVPPPSCP